ncbi:MAG: hypothetical protein LBM69_10090, partial [Lachnospiraceae bacterium]|nr:hypothetical protein [Lachnospiraceae bacterium]
MGDRFKETASVYPLGVHRISNGIHVAFCSAKSDCGLLLYDLKTGRLVEKIPFPLSQRIGDVHFMDLFEIDADHLSYQFYVDDTILADPYARAFSNRRRYGFYQDEADLRAYLPSSDFSWEDDQRPLIPYEDCICYQLHVRGFTKHKSSGVTNRGTFAGLVQKLPYLQALGITTVELQPIYEFLEARPPLNDPTILHSTEFPSLNYWGYQKGFYFAPKSAYAADHDACLEWKSTVKAFHAAGMELILQFYFPDDVPLSDIPDILHYWITEYHVD